MLSKIFATVLALALAQQQANAQETENPEMEVMTMAGAEAENLLTETSTEPMEGEEGTMATTAMEGEEMADEKTMEHDEEGHLHQDMTGELLHYPMPESCLSKSFAIGSTEGVEDFALFDNTEEILLRMTDHHHLHAVQICTQPETGYIHSLALHFEMMEEGESDKKDSIVLGGGPDGGECITEDLDVRASPDFAILFRNETETLVTGFGMFFTDDYFIRYGVGTTERIKIDLTDEESVVGMFGAQSDLGLHQIGLILANTTCVEQKAEAMRLELELLRLAALAQPEDSGEVEEESSSTMLIVVIIIIVVVIIIVIIVVIILKKKKNRVSKVTMISVGGKKDSRLPGTQNNSASLPNIETDDDPNYLGSGRGKSKETERDLVLASHD